MKSTHACTAILVALLLLASACAATGPVSGPVVAGAAAAIAVFDQLLAGGVIDPVQHQQLVGSINAMQTVVETVQQAQDRMVTTEQAITVGGTALAAAAAGLNTWRNRTRKKVLADRKPT